MIENSKTKSVEYAHVIKIEEIAPSMMDLWIQSKSIAQSAKPGQFLSIYCKDESRLLPRPISICEIDQTIDGIRLIFRVVGKGTMEFSNLSADDSIKVMGPIGNGFSLERKPALIIGGGVGIPPLLELSKRLKEENITNEIRIVLGYRDNDLFLKEELEKYGEVFVATEDGSVGEKGTVMNVLENMMLNNDLIYSCGPKPMLRAVKNFAKERNIKAQLSMEEKMACGIGACLACVCKTKEIDEHSNVHNKRVCVDGPVFYADEIEIDD